MSIERPADDFDRLNVTPRTLGPTCNDTLSKRTPSNVRQRLPKHIKTHFIAMLGEFVGTFLFLFFAFSATQVANLVSDTGTNQRISSLLYISLSFGFSLAINAWAFFRISGSLFNPAVTLAMALIGALSWARACLVTMTQIVGGIVAAAVVAALFPGPSIFQTTLGGGTSIIRGFFIEIFLTAELVFTICMLVAEKNKATFIAPIGIGLSLFIAELSGVHFTGGSLNPARSFGPCVVARSFPGYHWLYWIGPFLGSGVAVVFYKFIKALEYEIINLEVDVSHDNIEQFNDDRLEKAVPTLPIHKMKSFNDSRIES